jgi:methionyl-tRNA synthetase
MTGLQTEFERRVRAFLDAYDWEIQTAQLKLGTLFDANEYPTVDKLTDKFKFKMNYVPLPDAGDFRIDIEAEAKRELASQYADYYSSQFQSAMKDVWQRAYDAVSKMSERLDYTDATGKKIFRDSLVDNVVEMCDLMQVCNVTNDPVMQSAQQKLKQALQGVTPDALREDEHLRHETKAKVDEVKRIIDNLPGLGM